MGLGLGRRSRARPYAQACSVLSKSRRCASGEDRTGPEGELRPAVERRLRDLLQRAVRRDDDADGKDRDEDDDPAHVPERLGRRGPDRAPEPAAVARRDVDDPEQREEHEERADAG